jgi:hypothetical protein
VKSSNKNGPVPEYKPRVFLDTNVIFSGFLNSAGSPGRLLDACVDGQLSVVVSARVLDEIIRVVGQKVPEAVTSLKAFLFSCPPEVVEEASASAQAAWSETVFVAYAKGGTPAACRVSWYYGPNGKLLSSSPLRPIPGGTGRPANLMEKLADYRPVRLTN